MTISCLLECCVWSSADHKTAKDPRFPRMPRGLIFTHCIWRSWWQWMSLCGGLCAPQGNIPALIGSVCPVLSGAFIHNVSTELTCCKRRETYFPTESLWAFIITRVQCLVLPCSNGSWKLWILIESPGGVFPFATWNTLALTSILALVPCFRFTIGARSLLVI